MPNVTIRGMVPGQFVYELQPGERYAIYRGSILVLHPDRPPKIVYSDGSEEILVLKPGDCDDGN